MTHGKYSSRVIREGIVGAAAIGINVLLSPATRHWYRQWGAAEGETQQSLPGDELVPRPKARITIAITIHASTMQVWPWVIQIGCNRGGWYSYDLLDNGGVPSADRIIDRYQYLVVGDQVAFTPAGNMGFPVAAIEPGKVLVMGGTMNTTTGEDADLDDPGLDSYLSGAIIFYLHELEDGSTRLIYRMPLGWNASWRNGLVYRGFLEPISFVMARRTLLGIKERAEVAENGDQFD